jgi:hypothetical protein
MGLHSGENPPQMNQSAKSFFCRLEASSVTKWSQLLWCRHLEFQSMGPYIVCFQAQLLFQLCSPSAETQMCPQGHHDSLPPTCFCLLPSLPRLESALSRGTSIPPLSSNQAPLCLVSSAWLACSALHNDFLLPRGCC